MAHITLSDDEIRIELSLWERFFGLMRSRTIPRSAITEVMLETGTSASDVRCRRFVSRPPASTPTPSS